MVKPDHVRLKCFLITEDERKAQLRSGKFTAVEYRELSNNIASLVVEIKMERGQLARSA